MRPEERTVSSSECFQSSRRDRSIQLQYGNVLQGQASSHAVSRLDDDNGAAGSRALSRPKRRFEFFRSLSNLRQQPSHLVGFPMQVLGIASVPNLAPSG